jgi:hydroxyethylthiazole kinase-like uncharacterized protein yjeF
MIRGYTAQQVRDAEAPHLAAGEPLMRRAAHALADSIRDLLGEHRGRVMLVVGSGDNGGDALFAGAELAERGVEVEAVGVGSRMHEAGLAAALSSGVIFPFPVPFEPDANDLERLVDQAERSDVIVDGIVGTGAGSGGSSSSALRGTARTVVEALLAATADRRPLVVAVDLPSGLDPDSGAVADDVVLPATLTVTFGGMKAGLLRGEGPRLCGRIMLVEIGIEGDLATMTPAIEVPATSVT